MLAGEVAVGLKKVLSWGGGVVVGGDGQRLRRSISKRFDFGNAFSSALKFHPLLRDPAVLPSALHSFRGQKSLLGSKETQTALGSCPILPVHQSISLSVHRPMKGNRHECDMKPTYPQETASGRGDQM